MAKTENEKALNKLATSLRNKAHNARRNAYLAESERTKKETEALASTQAHHTAVKEIDEFLAFKEKIRDDFARQIEALKAQLAERELEHSKKLETLREARANAWLTMNDEKEKLQGAVDKRYPDLVSKDGHTALWSPAAWKPFEEFLPEAKRLS